MTKATKRTGRALASLGTLVVLFALVPLGLVAAARARFGSPNPLDDIDPPWNWRGSELADAASEPLRDDVVVNLLIRGSIGVIWLALAVIAVTTVVEVLHMVRHRGVPTPRVRGLAWAQPVARFVAAGLIVLLPTASMASTATASDLGDGSPRSAIQHALGDSVGVPPPFERANVRTDEDRLPPGPTTPGAKHSEARPDISADASTYVVRQGDSVWEIAAVHANGDAERTLQIAEAILEANLGHTMDDGRRFSNPALIRPGWTLVIPAAAGIDLDATSTRSTHTDEAVHPDAAIDRATVEPDVPEAATIDRPANEDLTYTVIEGDTLSSIADEHLGDAKDWPIVFAANEGEDMGSGRVFDDPDLLIPGWELEIPNEATEARADADVPFEADPPHGPSGTLPDDLDEQPGGEPVDEDATEAVSHEVPSDDAIEAEHGDAIETEPAVDAVGDVADTPTRASVPADPGDDPVADEGTDTGAAPTETGPADVIASGDTAPPVATAPTTTTSVPTAVDPGEAAPPHDHAPESPAAPTPIRLEHAALLAAGILSLVGVRRMRRLRAAMPRARVPVPPPDIASTERLLRTIEPGEGAARLDIALRSAAHQLAETGAGIGVVRLATDGHVTIRLTGAGRLGAPWIGMGADWELPASVPIELLADEARNTGAPCLALAQVGVDNMGRSVLVDLEAAGLTTIEARASQADDVIRGIATGIASSLHSEVAHLVSASLDSSCLLDHPNAHHRHSVDAAVDIALALAGSTITNEVSTFDLRALRTGGEMWEPAIVLFASADRAADQLTVESLPPASHGLALVCPVEPGQLRSSGVRIEAHADRWELVGFGERTELVPLGVTATELQDISALLDDADAPIDAVEELVVDVGAGPVDEPFEVLPHDIVVGLLGGVEVRSRSGDLGTFERSKTIELIAWLATHRERATRTAARTALWELDVRDATFANVVSEARRALGRLVPTRDGEEWLARTLNESLPLHERVVTDADLVEQRLEHARLAAPSHAIDVLRPAVELIRDMPFAGTSYLWPDADGLTSNLVLLATTVTAELAAHALSIGDTELVFWATGHGLRVLPGHEELIALRMRAHARAGDLAGVRQEWESYERVIVADAWSDGEPAPKLLDLRRELLSTNA